LGNASINPKPPATDLGAHALARASHGRPAIAARLDWSVNDGAFGSSKIALFLARDCPAQ
jgi:hypothetical protein